MLYPLVDVARMLYLLADWIGCFGYGGSNLQQCISLFYCYIAP